MSSAEYRGCGDHGCVIQSGTLGTNAGCKCPPWKLEREIWRLRHDLQRTKEPCTWYQADLDSDIWTPSCGGGSFRLDDGTPESNRMTYCCRCGNRLQESPSTQEPMEDDQ